jgi:thiamine kinase-like enzyme
VRICPIDWETAALAPGLLDLAALAAGNWPQQQKQQLAMAYYDALPATANVWRHQDDMLSSLRCCRLFQAIRWLGWSPDWQPPPEHRFDWLAEALQLAETIDANEC